MRFRDRANTVWQDTFLSSPAPREGECVIYFVARLVALAPLVVTMRTCEAMVYQLLRAQQRTFRNLDFAENSWLAIIAFCVSGAMIALPSATEVALYIAFIVSGTFVIPLAAVILTHLALTAINRVLAKVQWPQIGPKIVFI